MTTNDDIPNILDALEAGARDGAARPAALIDDLPLFRAAPAPAPAPRRDSAAEKRLQAVQPDTLTPREALDLVYELVALTRGG